MPVGVGQPTLRIDGLTVGGTGLSDVDALAARIPDGAFVALPPDYSLPAMDAGARADPQKSQEVCGCWACRCSALSADLLIGAGCVAEVRVERRVARRSGPRAALHAKRPSAAKSRWSTPPARPCTPALQATEKGVPFMPLRGVLGSDLVAGHADWQVTQNPFSAGKDPILLVPAIAPDVALFHARWADEAGNVWVGRRRELATIAHAARRPM